MYNIRFAAKSLRKMRKVVSMFPSAERLRHRELSIASDGDEEIAIRKFAEFGLSHWGDTQGVNITRRFLCEALSFQHRYIPIGLLERRLRVECI
ncbi:tRNA-dihydrouridine(47) synthase [NAD(P)(+)] [Cryptococcus amylolentus CBS 6039]|uniref:tRNA-dihydrouridine(47) synthase [NAD(P)(+)] n=2 Tax=Cryptococcus amylolentus TaxID=104669 RepID=A0A1E3H9V0_9TREE|nr:tRNA-dihydrouridine(47) synthase [NAD(P)(+)] [Cryptococcus amylolentus CBS 6039]ODN73117.1 tRNA-dihydrouridine(47) synthase [NAD(P)(+)] [Cryptococcus amylolentus CBS 6039]ODN98949.1 tRNA-dihydrouridine(47) synthase [NAD(P)(+)] [Cryptococcus amylolentus CBS 6273]